MVFNSVFWQAIESKDAEDNLLNTPSLYLSKTETKIKKC